MITRTGRSAGKIEWGGGRNSMIIIHLPIELLCCDDHAVDDDDGGRAAIKYS